MTNYNVKMGTGLVKYTECCYSCSNSTMISHGCRCNITGNIILNMNGYVCNNYKDIELLMCEICHKFVRSLGNHVHVHKITASKYKDMFGYNRTTGLITKGTKKKLSDLGKLKSDNLVKHNYNLNGGKSWEHNKAGYNIRDEGTMNQVKAKSIVSKETREKISKANKGKSHNKGLLKTEEWRKNLSRSHKRRLRKDVKRVIVRDKRGRIITYKEEPRGYVSSKLKV